MIAVLFVYLLSLVCWLGGMVLFIVVTQTAFTVLAKPEAGKFLAVLFPRYYMLGYICGAIGLILAVYLCATRMPRMWWAMAALALAVALGLTIYAGVVVRPRVDAIRTVTEEVNPDPARRAEFDRLHHLSVMLNGGVMLLDLGALLASAVALTPRG
jgi:MFS family permease